MKITNIKHHRDVLNFKKASEQLEAIINKIDTPSGGYSTQDEMKEALSNFLKNLKTQSLSVIESDAINDMQGQIEEIMKSSLSRDEDADGLLRLKFDIDHIVSQAKLYDD